MPNWCEGTLKVRGKFEDLKRFCKENFQVWKTNLDPEKGWQEVIDEKAITIETDNEECFWMRIDKTAYINGTHRNFIESNSIEFYPGDDGRAIAAMEFKAAWGIEAKPYVELAKQYSVDIRIYGFEMGMEFNQEIIIENGNLIKDEEIKFSDYTWECPMPLLGG